MLQALASTMAGVTGTALLSKLMKNMLYGVQPTDPLTFGVVRIVFRITAVLATCIPANKTPQIEPMAAFGNE